MRGDGGSSSLAFSALMVQALGLHLGGAGASVRDQGI